MYKRRASQSKKKGTVRHKFQFQPKRTKQISTKGYLAEVVFFFLPFYPSDLNDCSGQPALYHVRMLVENALSQIWNCEKKRSEESTNSDRISDSNFKLELLGRNDLHGQQPSISDCPNSIVPASTQAYELLTTTVRDWDFRKGPISETYPTKSTQDISLPSRINLTRDISADFPVHDLKCNKTGVFFARLRRNAGPPKFFSDRIFVNFVDTSSPQRSYTN